MKTILYLFYIIGIFAFMPLAIGEPSKDFKLQSYPFYVHAQESSLATPVPPTPSPSKGLVPCGGVKDCDFDALIDLIVGVIKFIMTFLVVPLAAIAFAIAGFLYITSGGNEGKVKQAHDIFWYTFLGLVIVFIAWLIINALAATFLSKSIFESEFWFIK